MNFFSYSYPLLARGYEYEYGIAYPLIPKIYEYGT